VPPCSSAKPRFATAVSAFPRCSDPVGLGAKRTRTGIAPDATRAFLARLERLRSLDRRAEVETLVLRLLDQHDGLEGLGVVQPLLAAARRDLRLQRPVVELHLGDPGDAADLPERQLELVQM